MEQTLPLILNKWVRYYAENQDISNIDQNYHNKVSFGIGVRVCFNKIDSSIESTISGAEILPFGDVVIVFWKLSYEYQQNDIRITKKWRIWWYQREVE